jgi:hypothetical protein
MDLAKSGLIRKVLTKGRGAEIFKKFFDPHLLRAVKSFRAFPCFLIGYLESNRNGSDENHRAIVNGGARTLFL